MVETINLVLGLKIMKELKNPPDLKDTPEEEKPTVLEKTCKNPWTSV